LGQKTKNAHEGIETMISIATRRALSMCQKTKNAHEGIETGILVVLHLGHTSARKQKMPTRALKLTSPSRPEQQSEEPENKKCPRGH